MPGTPSDSVYDPSSGSLIVEPRGELSSSLDDLRAAVEHSEQVADVVFADYELFGPGSYIKLVCSTELDQKDYKRIQFASLPETDRRKRRPDLRKMDEVMVYAKVIAAQTTSIELLNSDGETYRPIQGDLEDPTVLAQLGVMDPIMAVRRIFGNKDALLLRAGEELIEACGYGEQRPGESDGESDPT